MVYNDGDALVGSDLHRFRAAPRFTFIGSSADTTGSATAFQTLGSVVITSGTLSDPAMLLYSWQYTNAAGNAAAQLFISGASSTGSIQGVFGTVSDSAVHGQALVGSPLNGFYISEHRYATTADSKMGNIAHLKTSEDLVIFYQIRNDNAAAARFNSISIQAFRSTI